MAKDKNKTGRTPKNDVSERGRRNKTNEADEGSPKPGMDSGDMEQKSDRESEDRVTNDADPGAPKGSRSGQRSTPDRNSQRIEEEEDEEMDIESLPSRRAGTPRKR